MIDTTSAAPFLLAEHNDPPVRSCGDRRRNRFSLTLDCARLGPAACGLTWNAIAAARATELGISAYLHFDSDPDFFAVTSNQGAALRTLAEDLKVIFDALAESVFEMG